MLWKAWVWNYVSYLHYNVWLQQCSEQKDLNISSHPLSLCHGFPPSRPSKHEKFNEPFHLVNCSNICSFAVTFNVQETRKKRFRPDTKVPFNQKELPVDALTELFDSFCSHSGRVTDPYFCTLDTVIAALRIERQCIGIETKTFSVHPRLDSV